MPSIRVSDIVTDRILVSRESARLLEAPLRAAMASAPDDGSVGDPASVMVDFRGVEGIAPSFLDELVTVFESLMGETGGGQRRLVLLSPPTRLSSKFEAMARGHAMSVQLQPDGSWLLAKSRVVGS